MRSATRRTSAALAAAALLAGCGSDDDKGAPVDAATTATDMASLVSTCLRSSPPETTFATDGVPLEVLPTAITVLGIQREPKQIVANALIGTSVSDAHDQILRLAEANGWKAEGEEDEGKEAEVYLRKDATRVTVRLNRAGRCAAAATAVVAVARG